MAHKILKKISIQAKLRYTVYLVYPGPQSINGTGNNNPGGNNEAVTESTAGNNEEVTDYAVPATEIINMEGKH